MTVGNKLKRYKTKAEREMYVPGLRVVRPVNGCFTAAVDYPNYHLLKKSSGYGDDVAYNSHKIAEKKTIQMKDSAFFGKHLMAIVAFLREFKSACHACRFHGRAIIWLLKEY